ncbi:MAG: hypothetical protein H6R19_1845 [Proteobacteria bacterium]|nr:hypothetical protein [Pseudomonadota bacterium]
MQNRAKETGKQPCARHKRYGHALTAAVIVTFVNCSSAAQQVLDPPRNPLAPPADSVIFSTRFERPEALPVIEAFGATRVEWLYARIPAYVANLKTRGLAVGTTLNANHAVPPAGLARTFDDQPLIAPWMQSWGAKWISIASPATREALLAEARRQIGFGVAAIQFDDPRLDVAALEFGGEYSEAARQGFARWLADPAHALPANLPAEVRSGQFDYRHYLRNSLGFATPQEAQQNRLRSPLNPAWERFHLENVRGFFQRLRTELAPGSVALSLNLTNPQPDKRTLQLLDLADYVMAEMRPISPPNLALTTATVLGRGIGFVPSLTPHGTAETRRAIALLYALGAPPLVPWDVYMPDQTDTNGVRTPQARYFGTPAEYGDLYRFVRDNPALFKGWDSAAALLLVFQMEYYQSNTALRLAGRLQAKQIPFAVEAVQHALPEHAPDSTRLLRAAAVLPATELDKDFATTLQAQGDRLISEAEAARLSAGSVDEKDTLLLPRLQPARPDLRLLHLVRTHKESATLNVRLNAALPTGQRLRGVTLYAPGMTAQSLAPADCRSVKVPAQGEWLVLELQLQAGACP